MNLTSRAALRADVMQAEGTGPIRNGNLMPYLDCCGKFWRECTCARKGCLSIGHGRNLDVNGITRLEAEVLLDHDLYTAEAQATKAFEWFPTLNDLRQRAIVEMIFNVGVAGFKSFRQTILAIKVGQFRAAAANLLDSRWKTQVGEARSERIARYLKDGG